MEKFYDNIHIGLLIKRAEDLGYPSLIIALGLQMHLAPRILKAHEHHTFCELPSNGIIAGCTQSIIYARIFLYLVIKPVHEEVPPQIGQKEQKLRTFVYDVCQTQHGNAQYVIRNITRGALVLASGLIGSRCKISNTKSVLISTKREIGKAILKNLKDKGISLKLVKAAKDLGVGITGGKTRTQKALKHRMTSIGGRVMRIRMLRCIDHKAGRLFNTGAYPQGTYGKEWVSTHLCLPI